MYVTSESVQLLVVVTETDPLVESVRRLVDVTRRNEFPGMSTVKLSLPTEIDSRTALGAATVRVIPPTVISVSVEPSVTSLYAALLTAGKTPTRSTSTTVKRNFNFIVFVGMS